MSDWIDDYIDEQLATTEGQRLGRIADNLCACGYPWHGIARDPLGSTPGCPGTHIAGEKRRTP